MLSNIISEMLSKNILIENVTDYIIDVVRDNRKYVIKSNSKYIIPNYSCHL